MVDVTLLVNIYSGTVRYGQPAVYVTYSMCCEMWGVRSV